nr:MAG TPA: zinc finger protein [Caudoviricetes sp.]
MCHHAYVTKAKNYYSKTKGCRVVKYHDTCIFCGRKSAERTSYVNDPPKRKLPYFGEHLK